MEPTNQDHEEAIPLQMNRETYEEACRQAEERGMSLETYLSQLAAMAKTENYREG